MPISTINRVKTISVDITENTGNNIVTLYQNEGLTLGEELLPGYKIISYNSFIKNLKAYSFIKTLDPVSLPDIMPEDSDTEKFYKVMNIEWQSPRKQLDLFISSNETEWYSVGSISLLNPSGYPYRVYNLLDLYTDNIAIELGDNSRLGCQVKNIGYGLLEADDKVIIHGSYVEEIFLEYAEKPINITVHSVSALPNGNNNIVPIMGNNYYLDNNSLIGN